MRAALYARVSTEEQAREGFSLDMQIDKLREYCRLQNDIGENISVAGEYVDDGYSGRDIRRPAYRKMMDEIDSWDVLIVMKMDRIHRNSMNFMAMTQMLEKRGKKFISATESLDTQTALGKFVVDMIQRIAQLESEQIGERTQFGMREKAASADGVMGFTPPFGYKLSNGELKEDDGELPLVKRMFQMYMEGDTVDDICYQLNREGATTRKGNIWNKPNMRNILHNPVYAGYMRWEEFLIPHNAAAAVTPEEFNRVQETMASRTKGPRVKIVKVPEKKDGGTAQ